LLSSLAEASCLNCHDILEVNGSSSIETALAPIFEFAASCYETRGSSERITDKIVALVEELEAAHKRNPNFRAIVRLETRLGAHWLLKSLRGINNPVIRDPVILLGQGTGQAMLDNFSVSQSRDNLAKFKGGDSNILIATSVVQEGIDVPECDLVISIGGSVVSHGKDFIQLKGRARKTAKEGSEERSRFVAILQGSGDKLLFAQGMRQAANQDEVLAKNIDIAMSEGASSASSASSA